MKTETITIEKLIRRYGGKKKLLKEFKGNPTAGYRSLWREHEALTQRYFLDPKVGAVIEEDPTVMMDWCDNHLD